MSAALAAFRRPTPLIASRLPPTIASSTVSARIAAREVSPELEIDAPKILARDADSLALVENLVPGPKKFGRDPEGEEEFRNLEPNSLIRLSYVLMSLL